MKIASHHIKGTEENRLNQIIRKTPDYEPVQPWPEDCTVQWGHGIIPATPFFEAFPTGTFIRGEGSTIAEAEAKAFAKFSKEEQCDHQWGRQRPGRDLYGNGAGWCQKCSAFRSNMFKPIVKLRKHRKPLSSSEDYYLASLDDEEMNQRMDAKYPHMTANRKREERLLKVRKHLYGVA